MVHLSDCEVKKIGWTGRAENIRAIKNEHCCPSTLPQPPQTFGPHDVFDRVVKPINTFLSPDTVIPDTHDLGPAQSGDGKMGHPENTGDVIWLTTGI